jgi:predicted RNA-binding protein with PIN domain
MPFLIDGYNLLYALGRLTPRSRRAALGGARRWLLDRLRRGHGPDADVTVVFDGSTAPADVPAHEQHGRVRFEFSTGQTADDLIEDRIAADRAPGQLSVVSDDHRIRQAARRRGCAVLGCLDYYEQFLDARRPDAPPAPAPEPGDKPDRPSPEEMQHWLDAFGGTDEPGGLQ